MSWHDRLNFVYKNQTTIEKLNAESAMLHYPYGHEKVLEDDNIPSKLITITYNGKTIESYE